MFGLLPKGTVALLTAAVIVFAAIQYVPVYFDAWQFYDSVRQEVKFAGTSQRTVESVREAIIQDASELEIPLDPRDVSVTSQGPLFVVEIHYAVPVDLRIFRHEVDFDWRLTGETFR